jgi:DNA-binding transcriptional LysR family regulator
VAQLADAAAEALTYSPAHQQVLRIGTFAEAAGELTPMILSVYRELWPDVRLEFTDLTMVDQLEKLVSDEVDVTIVRAPFEDDRIRLRPIFSEPRVAALPRSHPLADAASISVDDQLDEPFATAATGAPPGWASYWTDDPVSRAVGCARAASVPGTSPSHRPIVGSPTDADNDRTEIRRSSGQIRPVIVIRE